MVYREELKVQGRPNITTFSNVTESIREITRRSGIQNGIVVIYSHHTTCCVITQEAAFDMSMTGLETLQQDFVDVMEDMIPACSREGIYQMCIRDRYFS